MIQTLFGRKVLLENINNSQVKHVDISKSNRDLISKLKEHHISYQLRDDNFFNSFSKLLNHQGVVISIESNNINNLTSLLDLIKSKSQSIILIIDNLQDPQNFGSILRTCEGMKVDGVIYKKDRQVQINDFVIKTSMGAIQHLNLIKVANLNNAISELKKAGYWTYASTLSTKSACYTKVKYDQKVALIVGNEEKGIAPLIVKEADFEINIPMLGKIQSLNVAVATGIMLGEINRQHGN